MQVLELNHIAIHVADVERSIAFYEKLGLEQMERPAFSFPGAWFRLGAHQELHIIGNRPPNEPVHAACRGNHFALRVASIEDVTEFLTQLGLDFRPAKQRPDGIWQIFLPDPDGHMIELTEINE